MKILTSCFYTIFLGLGLSCLVYAAPNANSNNPNHKVITDPKTNPKEIGLVHWHRSVEDGLALSKEQDKPVFLLFQEVPGCQGCQDFGHGPLNHPLVVEAIEELFVPVFIYNNKKGYDSDVLKQFNEPSWNYPVIRFIDHDAKDIIKKQKSRTYTSTHYLVSRMIAALESANKPVPEYLKLLEIEQNEKRHKEATFQMACYWTGESVFGGLDGVVSTVSRIAYKPKFLEVVDVTYIPEEISYETLVKQAMKQKCADKIYVHNDKQKKIATGLYPENTLDISVVSHAKEAKKTEQKYYLNLQKNLSLLPLTTTQATRLNSLVSKLKKNHKKENKEIFDTIANLLSKRQIELLKEIAQEIKSGNTKLATVKLLRQKETSGASLNDYTKTLYAALKKES